MINVKFTKDEELIKDKLISLKNLSGTHSPSIQNIISTINNFEIKVDACFLSNPYATKLYMNYFKRDILGKNKLQDLLEFYPSQNNIIAQYVSNAINVDKNNIFIGNGAIEIIQAVIQRFVSANVIINIPTFSSYYEFINKDVKVHFYKLIKENNFNLDINEYINFVKKVNPDTIVLINPNNPTGNYLSKSDLIEIFTQLSFVKNIIIDESFIDFAYESESLDLVSIASLTNIYKNLIIIKSMSKDFGIAGIRAGYGIMNKSKVNTLLSNGYLWNSNGLSEHFFKLYCSDKFRKDYEVVRKKYIKETQIFIKELFKIPKIKVYPSSANFVLIELPNEISAESITSILLVKYNIYVRNCDDKIGFDGNYIRIASRTKNENKLILEGLNEIFG